MSSISDRENTRIWYNCYTLILFRIDVYLQTIFFEDNGNKGVFFYKYHPYAITVQENLYDIKQNLNYEISKSKALTYASERYM